MKQYARILQYLRPHAALFFLAIAAMTVFAALDAFSFALLIPFLNVLFQGEGGALPGSELFGTGAMSRLLDGAVGWALEGGEPMDRLRTVVFLLFGIFLVKNLVLYVYQISMSVVEGRVTRDLRNATYAHLLRLDFPFYQKTRAGQVISRVTHDVDQLRTLVTGNLAKLLSQILQATATLAALLLISWRLTLVAAIFLPPMLGLWARFRKRLRRGIVKVLDAVGEVASHVQETVSGIRLVKASGAEEWEERRFQAVTRTHYKAFVRNERWRKFFPPATEMITATAILALLMYGSHLVLEERTLTASAFIIALGYAMKLMSPVKFIAQFPAAVQPGLVAAERVFELLDAPLEVVDRPGAKPVREFRSAIRLERVGFEYARGRSVLHEVDLEIRRGEVVALVGPSGSGKSTLADLLPRFRDPTAGAVLLDGVDLRELRLRDLRSLLGIVTQETIVFHDTVRANIAYAAEAVSQERVEAAARAANAHEFIAALPHGYDTVLGEKGTRLSGGQRQRIAIARALLRNPPILVLDEATSALDTESERLVQQAIEELMRNRTVLVIAHRLSTVRRADQIVVLEDGRIIERGTHSQLLDLGGRYHRLHQIQFEEPDGSEVAQA